MKAKCLNNTNFPQSFLCQTESLIAQHSRILAERLFNTTMCDWAEFHICHITWRHKVNILIGWKTGNPHCCLSCAKVRILFHDRSHLSLNVKSLFTRPSIVSSTILRDSVIAKTFSSSCAPDPLAPDVFRKKCIKLF